MVGVTTLENSTSATSAITLDENIESVCGFLEFVGEGNGYGYTKVRAVGQGTFQRVFSRAGKVIAISECITLATGQGWEAQVAADVQI